jgi:thiol-disulfide isomerase/thioredoxin
LNQSRKTLVLFIALSIFAAAAGIWAQQRYGAKVDSAQSGPHPFLALAIEPIEMPMHADFKASQKTANPGLKSIGSAKRKVTVVNFWATWCPPCLEEMPALSQLASRSPNVQFIGIGVDSESKVRQYLQKTPISFPVTASGAAAIDWAKTLGNTQGGLPFTAFFGPNGQLVKIVSGPLDIEALPALIAQAELGKAL